MAKYLLSVYQPDGVAPPEILEPIVANLDVLHKEMHEAGVWVFAVGLHLASTATVVRRKDGDTITTDGPFTEGKEHLGGFTVIDVPDLDAALHWGGRLSEATTLPIEVRPVQGDIAY
ncbi:MAG TPA: YciI family protein [Pseudonocardiaceae bacterium]|jgi:hypothetical protein|nr:YciI family protein [Pseudonocardiaceae bacterium]